MLRAFFYAVHPAGFSFDSASAGTMPYFSLPNKSTVQGLALLIRSRARVDR
jgi:hypothetical protein